jgi:hypothetical protein
MDSASVHRNQCRRNPSVAQGATSQIRPALQDLSFDPHAVHKCTVATKQASSLLFLYVAALY